MLIDFAMDSVQVFYLFSYYVFLFSFLFRWLAVRMEYCLISFFSKNLSNGFVYT